VNVIRIIVKVVLLTLVWVILRESVSVADIIVGLVISILCIWYSQKFIPLSRIKGVNFFKLVLYPLFLVGQIYIAGFYVIKRIFAGASTHITTVKTKIENEELRVILADSITLTPGSVLLDLTGDNITVVWLSGKSELYQDRDVDKLIKGSLEEKLLAAEIETGTS